jgi:hypothetical protein
LQARFLAMLLQTGSVRHAARAVSMSPSSAHRLRHRLTGTQFDRDWDEALALHGQLMTRPLALDHGAHAAPTEGVRYPGDASETHRRRFGGALQALHERFGPKSPTTA